MYAPGAPYPTWTSVDDLTWVFGSPGLLDPTEEIISDDESARLLSRGLEALESLRRDPAPFMEFIQAHKKSGRLGNYFESLLHFWLREILRHPRVQPAVAIRRGNDTLGELDFAFDDGSGETQHWEAAVKFYMCIASNEQEAADPRFYVGQRHLDRLDQKVSRCLDHQLPLGRAPQTIERLEALSFNVPPRSRLLMKGRLFYPFATDWRAQPGPRGVSPNHLRGWWLAFDPNGIPLNPGSQWVLLPKERWLASPRVGDSELLSTGGIFAALNDHFAQSENAIQVAEMIRDSASGEWREASRGMILKPGWNKLRPSLD